MTDQKPPDRIYLQADSQGGYEVGRDATWCDHQIDDEDVEYVLASEPESALVGENLRDAAQEAFDDLRRLEVARDGDYARPDEDVIAALDRALLATHAKPVVWCRCGDGIEDPMCKTCYMTDQLDAEPPVSGGDESYPKPWMHATIHLNPDTGELHSDGDHRVRQWIQNRLEPPIKEGVERFIALLREHAFPIRDPKAERVPDGSGWVGKVYCTMSGELIVTDGAPKELPDDHPLVHNCDEMGCSSVSHVIARIHAGTEEA